MAKTSLSAFEDIKHINPNSGTEYWFARELQPILEYTEWRNFSVAVNRAKEACKGSNINVSEHFVDVNKSYRMPNGGFREIGDIAMTRYACYLVVQNCDPSKEIIAHAQTYFAIQTRRQELSDQNLELSEDERRLTVRAELAKHNTALADAAHFAGVITSLDYAIFQNEGYKGLYGGMTAKDIHAHKNLKKRSKYLTTWEALSWLQIYSVQRRQKRKFGAKTSKENKEQTLLI